jgi:four helix bundle protein
MNNKFKTLKVWQKAMDLTVMVYESLQAFPTEEKFDLSRQLRRCAVSIPANIAEGSGRNSDNEFHHFLGVANGSLFELETELILAHRLNFIADTSFAVLETQLNEVQKMLYALKTSLKK